MKSKLWNGGFLRTVLQGLAVTCAALLALSALGAGLTLGGVIGQQQLSAAAVVISFLGVFPGAWLTARHAAGQKLPAAIVVGVCCLAVSMQVRAGRVTFPSWPFLSLPCGQPERQPSAWQLPFPPCCWWKQRTWRTPRGRGRSWSR